MFDFERSSICLILSVKGPVALITTAVNLGGVALNHVEVLKLIKKPRSTFLNLLNLGNQEICGVLVRDCLTGNEWTIKGKVLYFNYNF